jgi:hypothetical protein
MLYDTTGTLSCHEKKKKETNFSDFIINLSKQNQLPVYLINKKKERKKIF